jgi:hypothetical protein
MERRYGHDSSVENTYGLRCAQDKESARLVGMVDEEEALKIFICDAATNLFFLHGEENHHFSETQELERDHYERSWSQVFDELQRVVMEQGKIEDYCSIHQDRENSMMTAH